jgi:hypothetical protein
LKSNDSGKLCGGSTFLASFPTCARLAYGILRKSLLKKLYILFTRQMWKYSNAGEDEIRKVIGILAQKQSDDLYEDGADIARILLEKINNVAFLFLPKANQ